MGAVALANTAVATTNPTDNSAFTLDFDNPVAGKDEGRVALDLKLANAGDDATETITVSVRNRVTGGASAWVPVATLTCTVAAASVTVPLPAELLRYKDQVRISGTLASTTPNATITVNKVALA